jgi:hypothetical protein
MEFNKEEILSLLQQNDYHSVEQSDSEDEDRSRLPNNKRFLHVYDQPWRSDMASILRILFTVFIKFKRLDNSTSIFNS